MIKSTLISPQHIHAVILSGGEGRRMGGVDKGLALFQGQALAIRAAQRLLQQNPSSVGGVSINANRHLEQYQALGHSLRLEVFSDGLPSYEGPLGGVLAALRACTAPYLAVLPCDVPFFPEGLFTRLAHKLANSAAQIAMPLVTQADGSTFPAPVFMLMHASVLSNLNDYFAAGGRKITTWAGKAGLALVPFDTPHDALAFRDADTVQALADLEDKP